MRSQMSFAKSLAVGAFTLVPGLLMGGSAVAQNATPTGPSSGYPVTINDGSCTDLTEEPKYEIGNAVTFGVTDDGDDVVTIGGPDTGPVVLSATSTIDSSLDDLAEEGTAVAVHASEDDYGTIVSCGAIAGVKDDGKVIVPLNSSDDSTVVGIAILDTDNSGVLGLGDDQVKTTVYIFDTTDTGSVNPEA